MSSWILTCGWACWYSSLRTPASCRLSSTSAAGCWSAPKTHHHVFEYGITSLHGTKEYYWVIFEEKAACRLHRQSPNAYTFYSDWTARITASADPLKVSFWCHSIKTTDVLLRSLNILYCKKPFALVVQVSTRKKRKSM